MLLQRNAQIIGYMYLVELVKVLTVGDDCCIFGLIEPGERERDCKGAGVDSGRRKGREKVGGRAERKLE